MVVTKEDRCDSQAVIDCVTSAIPGGEMVYKCIKNISNLSKQH